MGISRKQAVLALHSLISRETLNELVEEILLEGQDDQSVAHGFYRACVDLIPSKGFRKGSSPPIQLLISNSTRMIDKRGSLLFYVLLITLLQTEEESAKSIREFM